MVAGKSLSLLKNKKWRASAALISTLLCCAHSLPAFSHGCCSDSANASTNVPAKTPLVALSDVSPYNDSIEDDEIEYQPQSQSQYRSQPKTPTLPAAEGLSFDITREDLISVAELNVFGRTDPGTGDQAKRLAKLESAIFDDSYEGFSREVETRLSTIFNFAPPSDELLLEVNKRICENTTFFSAPVTLGWTNSLVQKTTLLELALHGKAAGRKRLEDRVKDLESVMFGADEARSDDLSTRVNDLVYRIAPPDTLINKVVKQNGGWSMPKIAMPKMPDTSGLKEVGRNATSSLMRIATNPTLWEALIAAGMIYGAVELINRGYFKETPTIHSERSCTGSLSCPKCKNCFYCPHCNGGGSPCGVKLRNMSRYATW